MQTEGIQKVDQKLSALRGATPTSPKARQAILGTLIDCCVSLLEDKEIEDLDDDNRAELQVLASDLVRIELSPTRTEIQKAFSDLHSILEDITIHSLGRTGVLTIGAVAVCDQCRVKALAIKMHDCSVCAAHVCKSPKCSVGHLGKHR